MKNYFIKSVIVIAIVIATNLFGKDKPELYRNINEFTNTPVIITLNELKLISDNQVHSSSSPDVHIKLEWQNNNVDLDLRLRHPDDYSYGYYDAPRDCCFTKLDPDWGILDKKYDNPKHDGDDIKGPGDENITSDLLAENGDYKVIVHGYSGDHDDDANITVNYYGEKQYQKSKNIKEGEVWVPFIIRITNVFVFDEGEGVFCVETSLDESVPAVPLKITVYEANASDNGFGNKIAEVTEFNCYNNDGKIDNLHQRVYFNNNDGKKIFVKIDADDTTFFVGKYNVSVKKARPVILIHGIECFPKIKDDIPLGKNSMGNWEKYLPYDANCYPVFCYNFSWDSLKDNLLLDLYGDGEGKITEIVNCSEDVNPSVEKLKKNHKMDVSIIAHSMGGYIARYALKLKQNSIDKVVLLASPMYGSDIAHIRINDIAEYLKETSKENLTIMRHGSNFGWEMHKWEGKEKCLCIAGEKAPARFKVSYFTRVTMGAEYARGLYDSDGVVPVSSATLEDAADNKMYKRDHGTIALATYIKESDEFTKNMPWNVTLFFQMLFRVKDHGLYRWPAPDIFKNDIYKDTRDYISNK